jgi:hypothetical protein
MLESTNSGDIILNNQPRDIPLLDFILFSV